MSLFQKLVAAILYAGHSGTVVSIIVLVNFSELTLLCLKFTLDFKNCPFQ